MLTCIYIVLSFLDPVVELGATYPTSVLPDYDNNSQIRHTGAVKVRQFNWRDENYNLIVPWSYLRKLCAGTIVLLAVTTKRWLIEASKKNQKQSMVSFDFTWLPMVLMYCPSSRLSRWQSRASGFCDHPITFCPQSPLASMPLKVHLFCRQRTEGH